jgi:succinyl-CoA synthetase alpha subunit
MMRALAFLKDTTTRLIGPNCPGLISAAGQGGHHSREYLQGRPRRRCVQERHLTYEAIHQLTALGLGQTTCIGIGGDPHRDVLHRCTESVCRDP